jgi:hypothetical protein
MCVSTREEIRFPSVPDRPLQHLSALESMTCEQARTAQREMLLQIFSFRDLSLNLRFTSEEKQAVVANCVRPLNVLRSATATQQVRVLLSLGRSQGTGRIVRAIDADREASACAGHGIS